VIRNHWGKASNVTVTLEAWAEGAFQQDPYVDMIIDTVNYGAVGSFNWKDNGLFMTLKALSTGVEFPFRFTTDPIGSCDPVMTIQTDMRGIIPFPKRISSTKTQRLYGSCVE
jgi:hypothetical protein